MDSLRFQCFSVICTSMLSAKHAIMFKMVNGSIVRSLSVLGDDAEDNKRCADDACNDDAGHGVSFHIVMYGVYFTSVG